MKPQPEKENLKIDRYRKVKGISEDEYFILDNKILSTYAMEPPRTINNPAIIFSAQSSSKEANSLICDKVLELLNQDEKIVKLVEASDLERFGEDFERDQLMW